MTRRARLMASVLAAVGVVAASAAWAWLTPEGLLRERLVRWQFWTFELQFLVLAAASVHQLRRSIAAIAAPRRSWLLLGAAGVLCLALTAFVAPRTPRILFDEQIYQAIGRSMADDHRAEMCNDGTVEYGRLQCWSGEYNKQPHAYPYVLSVAYRAVGAAPWVAHAVNTVAAVALVGVVFLLAALVTSDTRAALGAALVMALIPMQLQWANTAAAEPTAALACAVAILAAIQFLRARTTASVVWMFSATTFAASFRPECVLVVALVAGLVVFMARDELARPRFWWAAAAAATAGWNVVAHAVAVRHEGWGTTGQRMGLEHLAGNFETNGAFYVWDERFPAAFTLLAVLAVAIRWREGMVRALLVYFGLFWGVFLFFYAGSYDYGADVRYSLMTYAPLAVLAGIGASLLVTRLEAVTGKRVAGWGAALLAFHGSTYLPLVRAVGEEAWAARADVEFIDRVLPSLSPNSIVVTHVPSVLLLRGMNAAQTSIAATNAMRVRDFADRFAGGVYLHWNFWCNVADPAQQAFCTAVLQRFPHQMVAEERVRNYRFALYRLRVSAALPELPPSAGP